MFKAQNPEGVPAPPRHYVHSIEVPANYRWVSVSGQVALREDGTVPETMEEQTEMCWQNIVDILAANDMDASNIVKVTQFLLDASHRDAHMAIRNKFLGDHKPTSTLLVISALAQPEFLVEVEVTAAGPA